MKQAMRILMSVLFFGLSLPAAAAISAWLSHDQIGPGETAQLTLQHDGQTDSQPDLSPLKQDFEIVGRSSGSNIQIINGKMSAQVQISLMLLPKHNGKLQIPALQWDGQPSPPLALTVSNNGAASQQGNAAAGKASHVFVSATLEQKQPYVQAAVPLTVRIYTDQPLYQASLDLQSGNDVLVQQQGQDRQTSETRNGRNYQVIERRYLLFPQRSGKIELAGPVLSAQVQDTRSDSGPNDQFFSNVFGRNPFAGMLNATKPIRIQGDPLVLNVRPRPDSAQGHDWLPAQKVTLEETWQPDKGQIHAGDPITRHLHLSAEGLTAAQLPDLSQIMQLPPGMRAYPDQPKLSSNAQGNNVIGTRDQDIAVIATNAGHFEIPALHLFWWDTAQNVQREIVLPARTLDVLPGTGGVAVGTAPPPQDAGPAEALSPPSAPQHIEPPANDRWKWLSLALALLWLGTLATWWRSSRRNAAPAGKATTQPAAPVPSAPRIAEARKAFWQACRDNNAQAARRHLLDWALASWPTSPPAGLKALGERLGDAAYKPLLNQLDRACYAGGEWQGKALLELKTLDTREPVAKKEPALAGLYPGAV